MPLFDFRCRACEHVFEALVRPSDGPPACPACQSTDLERLLTTFAVNSADRRQAAATKARRSAASTARQENMAREREIAHHRKEDH